MPRAGLDMMLDDAEFARERNCLDTYLGRRSA